MTQTGYAAIVPEFQSPRERYNRIIASIAQSWGVSVSDIMGPSRKWPTIDARHDCYAALNALGLSPVRVGRIMGRDPSSVCSSLKTRSKRIGGDE